MAAVCNEKRALRFPPVPGARHATSHKPHIFRHVQHAFGHHDDRCSVLAVRTFSAANHFLSVDCGVSLAASGHPYRPISAAGPSQMCCNSPLDESGRGPRGAGHLISGWPLCDLHCSVSSVNKGATKTVVCPLVMERAIACLRVSTQRQHRSGLEAQRSVIERLRGGGKPQDHGDRQGLGRPRMSPSWPPPWELQGRESSVYAEPLRGPGRERKALDIRTG